MTWYSILHGPEIWLAIALIAGGLVLGTILGMWIAALLGANREDDDEQ